MSVKKIKINTHRLQLFLTKRYCFTLSRFFDLNRKVVILNLENDCPGKKLTTNDNLVIKKRKKKKEEIFNASILLFLKNEKF